MKILLESRLAFIEKIEKEKGLPEALSACKGLLESISFRRIKPGEDFSSRKKKLPRLPFSREELLFMRFKLKQKLTQLERASGLKARKS
ncbi:MAG: hypothetical protein Q7R70_00845 [Candidatus Diapherotrites archaeon]|nr:hypothetical protein [Candidatus Diapherotrites archaeon]